MATWKLPSLPPMPKAPAVSTDNVVATGADELIARLSILPQLAMAFTMNGLLEVGQECMEDSKDNYCPFRFGILRQSGTVFPAEDGSSVILSYGGVGSGAEAYAREQHERMDYHHEIGGPKYLELAVIAWNDRIIDRAGQSVREAMEMISTGWASGDWKNVKVLRERPAGSVIKSYTRTSRLGKVHTVGTHFRRH